SGVGTFRAPPPCACARRSSLPPMVVAPRSGTAKATAEPSRKRRCLLLPRVADLQYWLGLEPLSKNDGNGQVPESSVARRLAALLVADVVGYSGLMRKNEAKTHRLVRADLDTVLEPRIRRYHGRIVKTLGDGIIAEFTSVVECVECALDLQEAMAKR